jgi:hypothetical protein
VDWGQFNWLTLRLAGENVALKSGRVLRLSNARGEMVMAQQRKHQYRYQKKERCPNRDRTIGFSHPLLRMAVHQFRPYNTTCWMINL